MTNPTNGGWDPHRDPYEATPPPAPRPNPPFQSPNPPPPPPAYQNPAHQNPAHENPAHQNPAHQNPAYQNPADRGAPDPNAGGAWSSPPPPPGASGPGQFSGQFGGGPPPPGSRANLLIIAVTAVVVVALVVIGIVLVHQDKKTAADPTVSSALPSVVSAPVTSSTAAQSTASTAAPSTTTPAADTPTASTTSGISNKDELCTDPMAQTDLIHLTVSLGFVNNYKDADAYEKGIIDSCATPAVIKQLAPFFGKTFGLPGGDLTGGNNSGATARYSIQLVNTSTYVSFTMDRRSSGGYQVVAVSSS